jgi:hypothetical protein
MTTARIWLSALPLAREAGSTVVMTSVCRYSRPVAAPPDFSWSGNAVDDAVGRGVDELVQEARDLPRVARDFGDAFLVVVELLEREDRQVDVVLLEPEQARGVVHQTFVSRTKSLLAGTRRAAGTWLGRGFRGPAGDEG